MARDWLRLVLAAAVALAVAEPLCAFAPALAQTAKPAKTTAKKSAEPEADEQGQPKKKKQDPAEAQKTIDAAQKLIEGGKADAAVSSLTAVLNGGNLPPGLMSRALLYRGAANRQLQKPALAIQDLTQALWIKGGLTESDRSEALRQRSAAYADAGVGDTVTASAPRAERVASSDGVTTGANRPQQEPQSASSGWNVFGNLFGGSTSSNPPPVPPSQPKAAAAPPPAKASVSGWSSSTEVRPTSVAMAPPPASSTPQPAAAPARFEGKFRVQLGLVRSESEAEAIATKVGGELAQVFETRRASIDQTVVGNMGTMYRVRVGPYATAQDGQAVCERLKGTRLDCLVTQ